MKKYLSEVLFIIGDYKNKLPYMVLLFLVLSVLDVVSLGLVAPYLALLNDSKIPVFDQLLFVENYIFLPTTKDDKLIVFGVLLLILFLLKTFFIYYINKKILLFSAENMIKIRTFLMRNYQLIPYSEYLQRNSAEFTNNILSLTNSLNSVLAALLKIMSDLIVGAALLSLLFISDPFMVTVLFLVIVCIILIYDYIFRSKLFIYGKAENMAGVKMLQGIREGMNGLKDIRILGKEKYFYDKVKEGVIESVENNIKASMIQLMPRYIIEFSMLSFVIIVVIVTTSIKGSSEELMGTIILFGVVSLRLLPVFNGFSNGLSILHRNRHTTSLLYKDLNKMANIKSEKIEQWEFNGDPFSSLKFRNIFFTYKNSNNVAIDNVSIDIKLNETIGIIGRSGSGKTTLVNIILGLLNPNSGKILYNDILAEGIFVNHWKNQVAYLPQQVFLTDDTLCNNVALGDNDIDKLLVIESIKKARLLDFVNTLS